MDKYFKYLLADLEALFEQAPLLVGDGDIPFNDEEEWGDMPLKHVKICDLIGYPVEAFPPEHLLTDLQIIELVETIGDLWSAWGLQWEMPVNLPVRNQYTAFVKEFSGDAVAYHPELGGTVHICQFQAGKCCPFLPDDSFCSCREIEECTNQDIELWEEYVYSLGLDPYREMTAEEEARFEEDMRRRRAMKEIHREDYLKSDPDYNLMLESELTEEEQKEFLFALEMVDELIGQILDDISLGDLDILSTEEEEDPDIPF